MNTSPSPASEALTAPADDTSLVSSFTTPPPPVAASAVSAEAVMMAQKKREEAWRSRNDWSFQGKSLEAWSMERESLLALLFEADVPAPKLSTLTYYENRLLAAREKAESEGKLEEIQHVTLESLVDVMELYPTAAKLLFLVTRKPEEWDHLRGRDRLGKFLRTISDWAEIAIAQDPWPAVLLARDIYEKYELVRAQRRPYHTLRNHSGN